MQYSLSDVHVRSMRNYTKPCLVTVTTNKLVYVYVLSNDSGMIRSSSAAPFSSIMG
jgi:hypothetical protein